MSEMEEFFFVDITGGTGEKILISSILGYNLRTNKRTVASSKTTATLLEGGRTYPSTLQLPFANNY